MEGSKRPRTILFLISDTGAGHRSAANAITRALHLIEQGMLPQSPHCGVAADGALGAVVPPPNAGHWQVAIVDVFAECGRFPLRKTVFLYGPATQRSPRLYGQLYRMTNSAERFQTAYRIAQPFIRQGLRDLLERLRPDVIVSVHPLVNHVTLQVLRDLGIRIPIVTVVTDLVSIHASWIARGVDACVVPTEAARALALAGGIPARRIRVLGMPIDPRFAEPPLHSRAEQRALLGLDPTLPAALIVGGGEGAGGLAEAVRALVREQLPAQLLIVTGRNRQLFTDLQREQSDFRTPTHLFGFVRNMPELMRAADVIVTKAGPGTISEAIACQLPIILTGAVPGQEEGNIDYVVENELGVLARTPEQIVQQVRALLDPENPELPALQTRLRQEGHPRASLDIARLIVSFLPQTGAASPWDQLPQLNRRHAVRLLGRGGRAWRRSIRPGRGRGSATRKSRSLPLAPRARASNRGHPRRIGGLVRLAGARALLLRGTNLANVQLRRPGGR